MRLNPITATASLLLALTLTACGSSEEPPADKPTPTTATATAKAYTYADCVALLDYDFTEGELQDASKDPECAHLTRDEYVEAVGEVLANHKDEIINPTP